MIAALVSPSFHDGSGSAATTSVSDCFTHDDASKLAKATQTIKTARIIFPLWYGQVSLDDSTLHPLTRQIPLQRTRAETLTHAGARLLCSAG